MSIQKRRTYCPEENLLVLGERNAPNHLLHLVLSIVTGGLWLIVWLFLLLKGNGAYRCPNCGAKTLTYLPRKAKPLNGNKI